MYHPLYTACINLLVVAFGGVIVTWFLAQQRARRLDQQLKELIKIIEGGYLDESEQIWLEPHQILEKWNKELELIKSDVEKGAERFVRLNAQRKRELESLLTSLPEANHAIDVLYGKSSDEKAITTQQHALNRVQNYRANLSVGSFFESPWPRRLKDL